MGNYIKNYTTLLEELLAQTGWTQGELASRLGVTFATLSRWLHRHAEPHPSHRNMIRRLHHEFVGLKPIPKGAYNAVLRSSESLREKNPVKAIQSNGSLQQELVVDLSFHSNTIEGTSLTYRETHALIVNQTPAAARPFTDNLVISNHAAIMRDILRGSYAASLVEDKIKGMHQRLFQGIRDDAGEYSSFQRGIIGLNIHLTHPRDIPVEMRSFTKDIDKKPKHLKGIEWIARCHARFELIHPFGDGNGRIGRLIILMQCLSYDYPPVIIEEKRRAEYYEVLEEAQRRREDHLVSFFVSEMERTDRIIGKYR